MRTFTTGYQLSVSFTTTNDTLMFITESKYRLVQLSNDRTEKNVTGNYRVTIKDTVTGSVLVVFTITGLENLYNRYRKFVLMEKPTISDAFALSMLFD